VGFKHADSTLTPGNMSSIHIINVLPGRTEQSWQPFSQNSSPAPTEPCSTVIVEELEIPGLRDVAVKEYNGWQQLQVYDESLKVEFEKACDVVLAEGLDLEQIHEDQDPDFLSGRGVKRGIARRFVRDIPAWAKRCKRGYTAV
jgi:hypothetical protein